MTIAQSQLNKIRVQVQEHLSRNQRSETSPERQANLEAAIRELLQRENAVIVAHYYTAPEIQALELEHEFYSVVIGQWSLLNNWRLLDG